MICAKCKKQVVFTYPHSGVMVCLTCKLKLCPPTMSFLKLGAAGMLYNIAADEYECYMDLDDFEKCGWFIRRKTISPDDKNRIVVHYYLEYHGNILCNRCKQTVFPSFYTECHDSTCCISGSKYVGDMVGDSWP